MTSPDELIVAVESAHLSFLDWSCRSFSDRARYILSAREYLLAHINDLAETISRETGKPLAEAITSEIFPIADLLYHVAKKTESRLKPERIGIGFMQLLGRRSYIEYHPYGVVAIIAPWNYPFAIPMGMAATAIMAGNTVVFKSSPLTPQSGEWLTKCFQAAELPDGTFIHIMGDNAAGAHLLEQPIQKVFFTGSVATGKRIMQACGEKLIPCVLELGGKDAMLVREDADLDQASSGAVWGAMTNCGQACASVERLYVHTKIAEEFIQRVVEKVKMLRVGNGIDPNVDIGPLASDAQLKIVADHVDDARAHGATILTGGLRLSEPVGFFYTPTVLTNVSHKMKCMREESFGPILPIMTFSNDDEAVALANDSPYGLTASIWTRNHKIAKRLASRLHAGTITINDCVYTHAVCQTPWGGDGISGMGRSHGKWGLMECVRPHHININPIPIKSLWWFPYSKAVVGAFAMLTKYLTGPIWKWTLSLPAFGYLLLRKKR